MRKNGSMQVCVLVPAVRRILYKALMLNDQVEAMFGGRFVLHGSVDDIRQQFAGLWQDLASKLPPPSDTVKAQDMVVPENGQRVRIYTPTAASGTKELPIGL